MKAFCVLEKGRSVNDPFTTAKKVLFTSECSDFYRLNWSRDDDPDAFICRRDIVWSEGRALLYESVPKDYEYYIFTDDDILFSPSSVELPRQISALLQTYRPLTGTFLDVRRFSDPELFNFLGDLDLGRCLSRRAFPVAGYDQQLQIFSKSYADVMFPAMYHGAGMSMWYSQWACARQYPGKQLCFSEIQITNTRAESHENHKRKQHTAGVKLVSLFNAHVKRGDYRWDLEQIQKDNHGAFMLEADRAPIRYTPGKLAEIYDIDNPFFRERVPFVADRDRYLKRLSTIGTGGDHARAATINRRAIEADKARKQARRDVEVRA